MIIPLVCQIYKLLNIKIIFNTTAHFMTTPKKMDQYVVFSVCQNIFNLRGVSITYRHFVPALNNRILFFFINSQKKEGVLLRHLPFFCVRFV